MSEMDPKLRQKIATGLGDLLFQRMNRSGWDSVGDSPIEKTFFAALLGTLSLVRTVKHRIVLSEAGQTHDRDLTALGEMYGRGTYIIIESQVTVHGARVDFLISVSDFGQWRSLVVECDGHDFHERTKQQASRDRSRDRAFQENGLSVFRFTGSDLWNDPMGCAHQVAAWVIPSWGAI